MGWPGKQHRVPPPLTPEEIQKFQPPVEGVKVPSELRPGRGFGCGDEGEPFFQYLQLYGCEGERRTKVGDVRQMGSCDMTVFPSYKFNC